MESLVECSFLIPVRRGRHLADGKPHSAAAWVWLEEQLWDAFEGGTLAPGRYQGYYSDPDTGQKVQDKSKKYTVAVPRRKLNRLRAILRQCCELFQQKSIYLSVAGKVEFIRHE